MSTIALVSCGAKKADHPVAAKLLYQGTLFAAARDYVTTIIKPDMWYILSAKYGLLHPDRITEPYECTLNTMKKPARTAWGLLVLDQMQQAGLDINHDTFVVLAGQKYVEPIAQYLPNLVRPLANKKLGESIQWLQRQVIV